MDTAVVFPGQGTQQPGMGIAWRDHEAWGVVERAEAALGEPLSTLLLDAPAETLARTREAQLAVLLTSLVIWEARRGSITQPVAFAGHSLGQVTALIASGVLTVEDGVQLAARRRRADPGRGRRAPRQDGRAARRHGRDRARTRRTGAPTRAGSRTTTPPARSSSPARPKGSRPASPRAKELGVRKAMPLNVGGAFHTPLMSEAADGLESRAGRRSTCTRRPRRSSRTTTARRTPTATAGASARPRHVAVPVRWREAQLTLAGARRDHVPRGRTRLDARVARQAHGART